MPRSLFKAVVTISACFSPGTHGAFTPEATQEFEREIEQLCDVLLIPGLSGAIVHTQRVVWARGFGYADVDRKIAAAPNTPYRIASLTKTFASTLLMQQVEQQKVTLEDPMRRYVTNYTHDRVTVRHVLSHRSEGKPGTRYSYSGLVFARLTPVIEQASGKPFRELLARTILEPLQMTNTVPGQDALKHSNVLAAALGPAVVERYGQVLSRLAKPYRRYGDEIVAADYPSFRAINASAGLISTVLDLAKYDTAVDTHLFIRAETQQLAWSPATNRSGKSFPYALGWFVQEHQGLKLVWHYGYWPTFSALHLKIPEKQLTLLLLCNSDGLSAPFVEALGHDGDVTGSPFACAFLRTFTAVEETPPAPEWRLDARQFAKSVASFQRASGYSYEREKSAHKAMSRWITERRKKSRLRQ